MVCLERTIRFSLNGPGDSGAVLPNGPGLASNTYSAWPAIRGLGRYYELQVACVGEVDPKTGYCLNIKQLDYAVRAYALPFLEKLLETTRCSVSIPMGSLMRQIYEILEQRLERSVSHLRLNLSRYHYLMIRSHDVNQVVISQQYEFSAAHRLHAPQLSDEENRRLFGKCNNPSGHGHNYRLEVNALAPIDEHGCVPPVEQLDELVHAAVIEKLDHKHLNLDVPQFMDLNPSVENIAKVIFEMLGTSISELGMRIESVRVWETEKTVCTYRGSAHDAASSVSQRGIPCS